MPERLHGKRNLTVAEAVEIILTRRDVLRAAGVLADHVHYCEAVQRNAHAFALKVERARRAGGPWPEPTPDVRAAVDREESERSGVALTEAITERLRQHAEQLAEALFRPRGAPTADRPAGDENRG